MTSWKPPRRIVASWGSLLKEVSQWWHSHEPFLETQQRRQVAMISNPSSAIPVKSQTNDWCWTTPENSVKNNSLNMGKRLETLRSPLISAFLLLPLLTHGKLCAGDFGPPGRCEFSSHGASMMTILNLPYRWGEKGHRSTTGTIWPAGKCPADDIFLDFHHGFRWWNRTN